MVEFINTRHVYPRKRILNWLLPLSLSLLPTIANAQDCETVARDTLFHSCTQPALLDLRTLPDPLVETPKDILRITGTYSSGDIYGVEGLAIAGGRVISKRYHPWDGLLVIKNGNPSLFRANHVRIDGQQWNIKNNSDRASFIKTAQTDGWQVIQSHLLIANGQLDLRDLPKARKFVRRFLFTSTQGWGIYQTKTAKTLFAAASEIQQNLNPDMVFNLDMGAYDLCMQGQTPCGNLFVHESKLTNILAVVGQK